MQRLFNIFILAILLTGCTTNGNLAPSGSESKLESTYIDSEDLKDAALLDQQSKVKTLFVFDIDDTLLTSETFFGSDYWYEWQKYISEHHSHLPVPCRFDVIAVNYETATQKATQADAPQLFNGIKSDKLFLTARSPINRGATERELKKAGYQLPPMLGGARDGIISDWRSADGKKTTTVSYHHGIYMVAGQDKGVSLLLLLDKLKANYERVVLVDDGQHNIDAMQHAMKQANIVFHGIHYVRIKKPQPVPKQLAIEADKAWANLSRYLKTTFPKRFAEITSGKCAY